MASQTLNADWEGLADMHPTDPKEVLIRMRTAEQMNDMAFTADMIPSLLRNYDAGGVPLISKVAFGAARTVVSQMLKILG